MTELFVLSIVSGVLMIYIITLKRKIVLLEDTIRVGVGRERILLSFRLNTTMCVMRSGCMHEIKEKQKTLNKEAYDELQLINRSE